MVTLPFVWVLGLIFITLKLCGVIAWSWWWVLVPLWGGFALMAALFLAGCIMVGIAAIIESKLK